ncbi:MAG: hypothetical protein CSA38_02445 [Flavobacteriales bacterium]|nr:MAG: hypothetical protein CSA38_02445 [Flavobacteriales bacterium]
MSENIIIIISLLLIIIGSIGTILPALPGLLVCFGGLLLFKFGTENDLPMLYIWIFGILSALSLLLDYIVPAKLTKKYGGTRWGSVGSIIGTILGLLFIPLAFGFLIGMLLGAFVGELLHDVNNKKKAFDAVKGAFIGFIVGTGFNFTMSLAMFFVVIYYLIF